MPAAALDHVPLTPCVILGIAGDERSTGFSAALVRAGLPPARVLDYELFVREPFSLPARFPDGTGVLRIESPGGDPLTRQALSHFGGAADEKTEATRLRPDHAVQSGLAAAIRLACRMVPSSVLVTHAPDSVALFYDKRACHSFMADRGFSVPRALAPATRFETLLGEMREARLARVFVKPRFGSGAAGIAALSVSRMGITVVSSAECSDHDGEPVLHHTSRLRTYTGGQAIAVVEAILAQDAHVEQWVPKAAIAGRTCDLRILTVGGEVAHIVLRTSTGPITNLDLGGRRADAAALRALAPPRVWEQLLEDCRRFAALFPANLHVAFDAALTIGLRRHVFFEVNAFGDLIRRVLHQGLDPYAWQVARLPAWAATRRPVRLAS